MLATDLPQTSGRLGLQFTEAAAEAAYRQQFLAADRQNGAVAIMVFAVFKGAFAVFDLLAQPAGTVESLLLLRLGFVLLSLLTAAALMRLVKKPAQYDVLMFAWAMLAVLSNFFTIAQRPSDHFGFLATSPILIVLLFAFSRNRFGLQVLASLADSIRRADAALYQAKAPGRDRVIVAAGGATPAANQANEVRRASPE